MQKEAYWLQKKCITIRTETEWVETCQGEWNVLMFDDLSFIQKNLNKIPENWNQNLYGAGDASEKIVSKIQQVLASKETIKELV